MFDLVSTPRFSDPLVRQAMYHAIDRQGIIDALFGGRAEPRISLASPLSWVFNENVPVFDYDVDRANALLDDAGWVLGDDGVRAKDGDRLEFTMMTISRTNEWALAIQPFLEAVGIRFDVEQVEFATWISRQVPGEYEGTVGGWSNGILDPRADLQVHFRTPRPSDATGYDNEEVNELFAEAAVATSREEEKPLYDEIQVIVEGTPVYVYLWRPLDLMVARADLILPEVQTVPELYARVPEWEVSGG
jgi:peptide/nickel transport system substrate-binding protein